MLSVLVRNSYTEVLGRWQKHIESPFLFPLSSSVRIHHSSLPSHPWLFLHFLPSPLYHRIGVTIGLEVETPSDCCNPLPDLAKITTRRGLWQTQRRKQKKSERSMQLRQSTLSRSYICRIRGDYDCLHTFTPGSMHSVEFQILELSRFLLLT